MGAGRHHGFHFILLALCCWLVGTTEAHSIVGSIHANSVLSQTSRLGADSRVALDEGCYTARIKVDGTFEIEDVSAGTYLLSVWDVRYRFPTLLVKVNSQGLVKPFSYNYELDYPADYFDHLDGEQQEVAQDAAEASRKAQQLAYPLRIEASRELNFVHKRAQYNPLALLKSPMILMMVGSIFLLFLLPKIMANIDPEEAAKMQENQNRLASALQGGDWKSAISGMMNPPGGDRSFPGDSKLSEPDTKTMSSRPTTSRIESVQRAPMSPSKIESRAYRRKK